MTLAGAAAVITFTHDHTNTNTMRAAFLTLTAVSLLYVARQTFLILIEAPGAGKGDT